MAVAYTVAANELDTPGLIILQTTDVRMVLHSYNIAAGCRVCRARIAPQRIRSFR